MPSAKAEYACVALVELAARHEDAHPVRLKDLAETHGIPGRFLVQILLQLKAAGLIRTVRGAAGGYRLARPPAKISLANVIDAVERSAAYRTDATESTAVAAVRAAWNEAAAAERTVLERTTLAELVQRVRGESFVYQI
jgi:Rrf2 family protein